jgi:hypothetical protein
MERGLFGSHLDFALIERHVSESTQTSYTPAASNYHGVISLDHSEHYIEARKAYHTNVFSNDGHISLCVSPKPRHF